MKILKSHFWYTIRQRNGILVLLVLLFSIQAILFFWDFSTEEPIHPKELAQFQKSLDSLKKSRSPDTKRTYTFNPNFISDFKGYQLGMQPHQIDRLFAFRKTGKYVTSVQEFQQVTGINDSLLNLISPLFKFPVNKYSKKEPAPRKNELSASATSKDLNKVSTSELIKVTGLDHKMAQRIIAYRKLLKGFLIDEQLFEVYDLDPDVAQLILRKFRIVEQPKIDKININTASFKTILRLPYIDYKLTKKIFEYKDQNGPFENLETLKKIDSFPIEKFDRIALYLSAE